MFLLLPFQRQPSVLLTGMSATYHVTDCCSTPCRHLGLSQNRGGWLAGWLVACLLGWLVGFLLKPSQMGTPYFEKHLACLCACVTGFHDCMALGAPRVFCEGLGVGYRDMAMVQNQWYHFGVFGATPILVYCSGIGEFTTHFRTYFSGWIEPDVHWGDEIWGLTHGHMTPHTVAA